MPTSQRDLAPILRKAGWKHPRIGEGALASIIALGLDLVGGGCISGHIRAVASSIHLVLLRRAPPNRRRLASFVSFFCWLAENEKVIARYVGPDWMTSANPHHPLFRRAFSRTPTWAALLYLPNEDQQSSAFYRLLTAELIVATMLTASSVHSRRLHAHAARPKDYALVAGRNHHFLDEAARGLRRLLLQPVEHRGLDKFAVQLLNAPEDESVRAHWIEWLRTADIAVPEKQSVAIGMVLKFVDHAHGIRRAIDRTSEPRSPAERDSLHVARGRSNGKAVRIAISHSAESHRTAVIRFSKSLLAIGGETDPDHHPDEESASVIVFASAGCESSTATYIQLRQANGLRRVAERAGIGLRWGATDLTPSEIVALNRVLIELSDSTDLRIARASLLMRTSLVIGRSTDEVRDALLWSAASTSVSSTIELVQSSPIDGFRVVVPKPDYRTEMTAFEEAACYWVSSQLFLPDVTGVIAHLRKRFGGRLPLAPFDGVTDGDISNVIKRVVARTPLLKRIRAARLCEPMVTSLIAQSGGPVRAALITGRTRHEAHVLLHYTALPARLLQQLYLQTLRRMGLADRTDIALPEGGSGMVGNPRCPKDEAVKGLFRDLENIYKKACGAPRKSIDAIHNAYCQYVVAAMMLALSMRHMSRPVPDYVDRQHGTVSWGDKMRDEYEMRFSVLAAVVFGLLTDYAAHRRDLVASFPSIVTESFFFLLDDNHRPVPFSSSSFPGPGVRFPLGARSLRRAMHSYLDRQGVSPQIIDALFGHTSAGRETCSPLSSFVMTDLRRVVNEQVSNYLKMVGVRRLRRPRWAEHASKRVAR